MRNRKGLIERKTSETEIRMSINLDGKGIGQLNTGLPFLEHMLQLFCQHGFFDMNLDLNGDLNVDAHHSLEDLGICLGEAVRNALGDKSGIRRYGFYVLPMDEALVRVVLDFSGRGRLLFNLPEHRLKKIGKIEGEVWEEFFAAFAAHAGLTLHIDLLKGKNFHHIIEAVFKALARAMDCAIMPEPRLKGKLPSTKGFIDR